MHYREYGKSIWYLLLFPLLLASGVLVLLLPLPDQGKSLIIENLSVFIILVYQYWVMSYFSPNRAVFGIIYTTLALEIILLLFMFFGIVPFVFIQLYTRGLTAIYFVLFFICSYFSILEGGNREVKIIRKPLVYIMGIMLIIQLSPSLRNHVVLQSVLFPFSIGIHFLPFAAIHHIVYTGLKRNTELQNHAVNKLFQFLQEVGEVLLSYQVIDRILDELVRTIQDMTISDGCVIFTLDEANEHLEVRSLIGFYPISDNTMRISRLEEGNIFWECIRKRKPLFLANITPDQRKKIYKDEKITRDVSSIIVIPLITEKRIFGLVSLIRARKGNPFSITDYNHAQVLTRYAVFVIENRHNHMELLEKQQIEKEVDIASNIQQSLVPKSISHSKLFDIAVFTKPLRGISGDYFDVIYHKKEQRVSVLICDVAGRGIPASLFMVMIRTAFHLIMDRGYRKEGEVITELNKLLRETILGGQYNIYLFATIALYTFWPMEQRVSYSNGGHLPILIYREDKKEIQQYAALGLPIGIESDVQYETKELLLNKKDAVLLCTDGIIETRNGKQEEYGFKRLEKNFIKTVEEFSTAREVLKQLVQTMVDFQGSVSPVDDRTLVVMRAMP